jgi:GTP cyclohydrolase IB
MTTSLALRAPLVDVQALPDPRRVAIDRVGVSRVRHPVVLADGGTRQHTVATFGLQVALAHDVRGTHMSRFLEELNRLDDVDAESLVELAARLRDRLDAASAFVDAEFPVFVRRAAPVSGASGMVEFTGGYRVHVGRESDVVARVRASVATLCPCSREISERGAHNQRGEVAVEVRGARLPALAELLEVAEESASCALYPVLKRTDEKWVTERAYDNPRFVEDVLREAAVTLREDPRVSWYRVTVENHESIHAHNAYAEIERWK